MGEADYAAEAFTKGDLVILILAILFLYLIIRHWWRRLRPKVQYNPAKPHHPHQMPACAVLTDPHVMRPQPSPPYPNRLPFPPEDPGGHARRRARR